MAKKEEIREWMSRNGLTKQDVNQMWDECCEVNSKCKMVRDAGKSWKNLPMSQIEKIPTLKEKTLRYLREKESNAAAVDSSNQTNQTESTSQDLSESERLFQKIKNNERLSEREIRSILFEYGEEVDEIEGDSDRWTQFISTIVKLCGQYVRIDWQRGLTEMQENIFDEQPYFVEKKERVVQKVVVDWNEIELDKESENNIEEEDMYK